MWKNIVEPDRTQMTRWCMHITCWIPNTKNTHSDYVKLITFPLHLLLCGSTVVKVLCYKSEGRWFDLSWCQWIFLWHKILPIALWPWGRLILWQKWVPGLFIWGKGGRCVRLTTYHHPVSSWNLRTLTSWNPLGPSGPVIRLLYLYLYLLLYERASVLCYRYIVCLVTFVWHLLSIQTATCCVSVGSVMSSEAFSLLWLSLTEELFWWQKFDYSSLFQTKHTSVYSWLVPKSVPGRVFRRSEVETLNLTTQKIFSPFPRPWSFKEKFWGEQLSWATLFELLVRIECAVWSLSYK